MPQDPLRFNIRNLFSSHYGDVILGTIASQITSLTIDYSTVYSDAHQRKHQSSTSLAFVRGIHRRPVNFPHKWQVTWKMFPFDNDIMHITPPILHPVIIKDRYTCIGISSIYSLRSYILSTWEVYMIMHWSGKQSMFSFECYFCVCIVSCEATKGKITKITLEGEHNQLVTAVHTLFYFLHNITSPCMTIKGRSAHIYSVSR